MQQDLDLSQKVFAEAIKLVQQKNIPVEKAQKQAITLIAARQVQTQKRRQQLNVVPNFRLII